MRAWVLQTPRCYQRPNPHTPIKSCSSGLIAPGSRGSSSRAELTWGARFRRESRGATRRRKVRSASPADEPRLPLAKPVRVIPRGRLSQIRREAADCRARPRWRNATQAILGDVRNAQRKTSKSGRSSAGRINRQAICEKWPRRQSTKIIVVPAAHPSAVAGDAGIVYRRQLLQCA